MINRIEILKNPDTWEGERSAELAKVRVLPPGTEIKLTVKVS
jgi:hypothetical protein